MGKGCDVSLDVDIGSSRVIVLPHAGAHLAACMLLQTALRHIHPDVYGVSYFVVGWVPPPEQGIFRWRGRLPQHSSTFATCDVDFNSRASALGYPFCLPFHQSLHKVFLLHEVV